MAEKRNEYVSRELLLSTIGLASASRLTDKFGGQRYRVPRSGEQAFIELARIVGYSAARMMAETWGGGVNPAADACGGGLAKAGQEDL